MSLRDALTDESKKPAIVDDCCQLIEDEVKDKGGMSGMAIKAGYKAVKGFKPGFVKKVVGDLLPEFADALEPITAEAESQGESPTAYLKQHSGRAADAMLAVTDGKADRSTNKLVKGTYKRLRPAAKKNVESAVPRLADLIARHT